ncbi:MAG: 50S ribosomal protein L29 [Robiginitomaculum sp.]|nr:50S ribosomal protein L29 [Robiginitomaculum sp.]
MNTIDLRNMSEDQLGEELVNLKKEQFNLRFQQATSQLEKPARIRIVRRAIAQVKTIMREQKNTAKTEAKK